MGQNRWYLTSILLGFLLVSLGVLAARWSVLAQRVPFPQTAGSASYSDADASAGSKASAGKHSKGPARQKDEAGAKVLQLTGQLDKPGEGEGHGAEESPPTTKEQPAEKAGPAARIDINSAGEAELDELPGIGPKLAQAIIEHRSTHGPFASVEALLDVAGIGEAKLAELRPHIEAR